MQTLKDRYFIRVYHKGKTLPERLPLANRQTLLRVFIHFLFGKINSLEIFNEDYFDKRVLEKERVNGKLIRKHGQTMRQKVIGYEDERGSTWDNLANQFREGLYDPESDLGYRGHAAVVERLNDTQFDDAIELFTLIQEGKF